MLGCDNLLTSFQFVVPFLKPGVELKGKTMLPDLPNLDRYFDLAEHLALRTSLLIFLLLALYRVIDREWRKR